MRNIRRLIFFIIISLAINLCLFGLFTVNGYSYIYNAGLQLNTRMVDIYDDEFDEYLFFNKQLNKNMVFLIESEPDSADKSIFFVDYIKYLNKENKIKYIFDEIGYAAGQLINLYLQTGDETFLNRVFESAPDSDIYTLYRRLYYIKLYEYNSILPQSDRISLFGIDTETAEKKHSLIYLDYLLNIIRGKSMPMKINDILFANRDNVDMYFDNIKISLEQNEALYKELFVENYYFFNLLIENYFTDKSDYNIRLQRMAVNFIKIYDRNIRGKYLGVFSDTIFIEKIHSIYDNVQNRIIVYKMHNYLLFDDIDKYGKIYTVNNKILKYFVNYREFVYKINGQTITNSLKYNDDAILVLNTNNGEI